MGAESWTVIGTGIVILVAIAASNRSMRVEFNKRFERLEVDLKRIELELRERLDTLEADLRRIELELRERLSRVEGLFEGMRESILGRSPR